MSPLPPFCLLVGSLAFDYTLKLFSDLYTPFRDMQMKPEFSQNKKIFDKSKSLQTFETPTQRTISSVDMANSEGNPFHL